MNSAESAEPAASSSISLPQLIGVAVGAWKYFIAALAIALITAVTWQWARPWYVSQAILQPVSADVSSLGRMAGLAAQFGIAIPSGGSNQSVDFYARLASSRGVLESVAKEVYDFEDGRRSTLLNIDGRMDGADSELLHDVVQGLRDNMRLSLDVTAGLLTIQVGASERGLAEQINRNIIAEIEAHNSRTTQALAGAERTFMDQRIEEVGATLQEAEDELRRFLQRNRTYQASPELSLEAARLERRVDLEYQLFLSLSQARDQARISEARNTPVVTLVESPEGSSEAAKFGKRLALVVVTAFMLVAFVVFWPFIAATIALPEVRRTIRESAERR